MNICFTRSYFTVEFSFNTLLLPKKWLITGDFPLYPIEDYPAVNFPKSGKKTLFLDFFKLKSGHKDIKKDSSDTIYISKLPIKVVKPHFFGGDNRT